MSPKDELETALKLAQEQEKGFDWLRASLSYQQALQCESRKAHVAEISEKSGFCYSQASKQANNLADFKKHRQSAVEAYKSAAEIFEKEEGAENSGRSARCRAIAEYEGSWLASEPSDRRRMLDECLRLGKKSLDDFEKAGDQLSYGRMCSELLLCSLDRLYIASDWREMRDIAQEGVDYADKAITALSKLANKEDLARAHYLASLQSWYAANTSEQEEKTKELVRRSLNYSEEALRLSKEIDHPYHIAMSNWAASICTLQFTEKVDLSLEYAKEMMRQGEVVRDNYLRGVASYILAFVTNWMTLREADPDKQKEGHRKVIQYAEDASRYLQPIMQDFFIAQAYLFYSESYSSLASDATASSDQRHALLEKAVNIGRAGLEHATRSGSPDATGATLHALSKALQFYSNSETGKDKRGSLLNEALLHRQAYNRIVEKTFPFNDWTRGVGKNYEGLVKAELARIEEDRDGKRALLENAIIDMEDGVSRCGRMTSIRPIPTMLAATARFEDGLGDALNKLYALTDDEKILNKAVEVYGNAAKTYKKVNLPSRVAESYWNAAKNQGCLGKHLKAAESFDEASAEYKDAAQKFPHFADFYLDYGSYMKAWSEIERAKYSHDREQYEDAIRHYEKTSDLLKSSKPWSYLSPNFLAWSLLEQAEDLSREENSLESKQAFNKAADLFQGSKKTIEEEIDRIQNQDEKDKAIELSKASIRRKDYCLARASVEEARIHDRKGDYAESAENYSSAAAIFEKIIETMDSEAERREIRPIASMCRAWEKMKMADGRASSGLYGEASELFLRAKEQSSKDRITLLASGNSAFCRALEHGTRFEETREKNDFSKAKQYLGSAASCYSKAGFDNASVWTSATEHLFDAYSYMTNAEVEDDPERKMKTYLIAEKCFDRSAALYENAGYVGKRDEVQKILKKVKEKREFALSLGELVSAPADASSTSMISAPNLTVEEPVGLLKFERALIQANLIVRQREIVVGEVLDVEVQLANLGKNAAFPTRMEGIIPEGFDVVEKPEKCIVDDGALILKGRRLSPMGSEEIRFQLKPKRKGEFILKPKIDFMDETGEHKASELEQAKISVKELGIRGWLRGPG